MRFNRFIILFFLSITGSWAMDDDSAWEMNTLLLLKGDSREVGEDDWEWNTDSEEETRALLPLKTDSGAGDEVIDLEKQPSPQPTLFEQNTMPTLINELFFQLVYEAWELDPHSIGHLFMVSKLLNKKIGELHLNVRFPSLILSFSPSVREVLDVIEDLEKCHRSVGPLTALHVKEKLLESPAYELGIKRLPKAERFFHEYSFSFIANEGSERIKSIESVHEQKFQKKLSPSMLPAPGLLRRLLSSMARDPWVFGAGTAVTICSAGTLIGMYYLHYAYSQQYQQDFENNLNFTNTSDYLQQYYNGNNSGGIYVADFPYNTPGCNNVIGSSSAFVHCFNLTDYCLGATSSLIKYPEISAVNIADLAEKLWGGFGLPSVHNISIENFQSALSVFFNRACAENYLGNFSTAHAISRLKPNSSFLLTNEVSKRFIELFEQCNRLEPGTAPIMSHLFNCDPLAVARTMTPVVRPLWQMVTVPAVFLVMFTAAWITLIFERCFDLYDDA